MQSRLSQIAPATWGAALAAAGGIGAIVVALIAQYGFDLRPCILCLVQRVPFGLAGGLGLVALLPVVVGRRRLLVGLAGLVLLINSGIAVYHVGVERHWWAPPGCSASEAAAPQSMEEMIRQANQPVEVPCDKPQWSWHGLTMAAFNIGYSGALGLVLVLLARRRQV